MDGLALIEKEHRPAIDIHLGIGARRWCGTQWHHCDSSHGEAIEIPEYRIHGSVFLPEPVKHPVARAVEFGHHRTHLGGDDASIQGLPQFLRAVVEHLGPVHLGLESAVSGEHREHLAVADTAHVGDQSLWAWVGHDGTSSVGIGRECPR